MGKAYYCDRCKKLFDERKIECYNITIAGAFDEDVEVLFCEGCKNEIETFVYGDDLKRKKKKK